MIRTQKVPSKFYFFKRSYLITAVESAWVWISLSTLSLFRRLFRANVQE